MTRADFQSCQMRERNTQKILSHLCSLGHLIVLCWTANCCLRAKFSAIRIERFTKRFRKRTQTAFKMDIDFIYPHQNMVELNLGHFTITSCKQRRTEFSVGTTASSSQADLYNESEP
ncbi:hypothetical protein ES703_10201 [subsurface metagenome]